MNWLLSGLGNRVDTVLFVSPSYWYLHVLQVEALCWCGKRATHNARTENGVMVTEGEVIVVGDVDDSPARVGYQVLCRQHHRRSLTSARAHAVSRIGEPLPFG